MKLKHFFIYIRKPISTYILYCLRITGISISGKTAHTYIGVLHRYRNKNGKYLLVQNFKGIILFIYLHKSGLRSLRPCMYCHVYTNS